MIASADEYERDLASFREEETQVFTLLYPNPVAVSQVFGDRVQLNSADADFTDLIDLSQRFNRFDLVDGRALGLGTFDGGQQSGNVGSLRGFNTGRRGGFGGLGGGLGGIGGVLGGGLGGGLGSFGQGRFGRGTTNQQQAPDSEQLNDVSNSDQGASKSSIVQASHEASTSPRVANPQAKMIRFDGQEFVLGNGEIQGVTIEALQAHVKVLLKAERRRSATALVALHRSAAHRCAVSRWTTSPDDPTVVFMAQTLDRLEFADSDSYSSLLSQSRAHRKKAKAFAESWSKCIASLHRGGTAVRNAAQTVKLAEAFGHSLPMADAARLEGLACLAAGKSNDAQVSFRRGLSLAEQHKMTATFAELALLASDAALTIDD